MKGHIDLRSDTVTKPDDEMRQAMATAEVGDDVYGEDPTVRQLEERSAAAIGMEAALFVPSGTMGNQIALRIHGRPGTEVICEASSHILNFEMAAMAALSGLLPRAVEGTAGRLSAASVEQVIAPDIYYLASTSLIALENTANLAGGTLYDRSGLDGIQEVARRHDLPIHLDGARLFNAAVALGVEASELARGFDSVMFCLSKGLGAPVGSMICGSQIFIDQARRVRKLFGGGLRQVGVLAAAGLVALRRGPLELAQDHRHAKLLAEGLATVAGVELDPSQVETNIVVFVLREALQPPGEEKSPAERFVARLRDRGVLVGAFGPATIRMVTHRDVQRQDIELALEAVRAVAAKPQSAC